MSFKRSEGAVTRDAVLELGSLVADIVMKRLISPGSVLVEDACFVTQKNPPEYTPLVGRAFDLLDLRVKDEKS
jgi:hypothetical protein